MKKILILALLVTFLVWPKIETARTVEGAGGELFGSAIKTTLALVVLYFCAKVVAKALGVVFAVIGFLVRRGRPKAAAAEQEQPNTPKTAATAPAASGDIYIYED